MKRTLQKTSMIFSALVAVAMAMPSFATAQEATEEEIEIRTSQEDVDVDVQVNDGKVVIRKNGKVVKTLDLNNLDADGTKRKTKTKTRSIKIMDDNENAEKKKILREAILIGPDGPQKTNVQQWVFDATDTNEDELVTLLVDAEKNAPAFAIGVSCSELPAVLSAQMKLKNGLVVDRVFEKSAAADAGVAQHDIIIKVDGSDLANTEQLVEAIQAAGNAEKDVQLKIIRVGEDVSVSVKPVKRESSGANSGRLVQLMLDEENAPMLRGNLKTKLLRNIEGGEGEIEFGQVLPGMIQERLELRRGSSDSLAKEIAELREQIEQLRQEIRNK